MKLQNLKLIGILFAVLGLTACIGDDVTNNTVQNITNNNVPSGLTISGAASNCQVSTGTCNVGITVAKTGSTYNGNNIIFKNGSTQLNPNTASPNPCTIQSSGVTTCSFTFNLSGQANSQITIYSSSTQTGAQFSIGAN